MKQGKAALSSFEEITFPLMEQLFRLAYSRIGNVQDAEDVVQETYLKAYIAFEDVRRHENIRGWLTRILINAIKDQRRKRMRAVDIVDIVDMDDVIAEPTEAGVEERICRDEIDPTLMKALLSLPETFLNALLLREIHGAAYDEIAEILNIPVGTVMSRLFRARKLVREAFRKEGNVSVAKVSPLQKEKKRSGGSTP